MPSLQLLTMTRVSGEIQQIRFENSENGFVVATLLCGDGKQITVCGIIPGCNVGCCIEADGKFEEHASFGLQFRISEARIVPPSTEEGIRRFLSFAIPGIGPKTAAAIVKCFGKETVQVLDLYPKRLLEVPKIGPGKAAKIIEVWKKSHAKREEMIFLQGLGLTPGYCAKLFKQYGEETVAAVRRNPYRLAEEINGIGFLKADAVARELGFAADSTERLEAAAVFLLNSMIGEGHACSPADELLRRGCELTGQSAERFQLGIAAACQHHLLYEDNGFFYTPYLLLAEEKLPRRVAELAAAGNFAGKKLKKIAPRSDLQLDDLQKQAVEAVAEHPLTIITGGPGVGKTTVIGEIVRRAKMARIKLSLAAPTGRAAKRMSESSGLEAKTIHRLLVYDPATGKFAYDRSNPLDCRLLIVDEVSMLDLILAHQLFQAIPDGCSVILVGDADQLPSVGPGRVLHDLMASGYFAVTRLTKIFRQAENSRIITNAHRVNEGKMPLKERWPEGTLGDFYWIEQDDPDSVVRTIEKLVAERIPLRFHCDPMHDVQLLCPMNRGSCGTASLNETMRSVLNGNAELPSFDFGSRTFRAGDRVMQTANNYDKNVFNGDLGRIVRISTPKRNFTVEFEGGKLVDYNFDEADQITLAYAITIHKSQGSEFPVVILPLLTQHYMMLQRNLLYTGMTRAKKLLILIGSAKAVELAVRNIRLRPRFSQLARRFAALKQR